MRVDLQIFIYADFRWKIMAERVEIRGGELDGSVLDNAATEATLLRLVSLMEKSTGTSSGGGAAGKLQELYNRALGRSVKETNNAANEASALGSSFNKAKNTITETTGVIGNLLGKTFGMAITGATLAVNGLKDFLTASYTEFKSLSESGASFNNNMVEASKYALSTGMSLRDFTGLIQKNNTVLTSLGGTATEGAKRLSKLSDEIRTGSVGESLFGLGLTTNEINDYLGSYLEQQQRLGSLQKKDDRELREGTRLYAEELDKVSKLYGIERKRLDDQAKKQSLDPVLNILKRGLSPEELAKSTANLAAVAEIGGQELQDAMKEIATGVVRSDLAKGLMSTGALNKEAARELIKGRADVGQVLQDMGKTLDARNELNREELSQASPYIAKLAQIRDATIKVNAADLKKRDQEAAQRSKLTTAFGRFPAILDNLINKILGGIVNNRAFDAVVNALEKAATELEKYFDPIVNFFSDFASGIAASFDTGGLKGAFQYIFDVLQTTFDVVVLPKLKEAGTSIAATFRDGFEYVKTVFKETVIPGAKAMLANLFGIKPEELSIGKIAGDFITGMFSSLWTEFKNWIAGAIGTLLTGAGIGALFGGLIGMIFGPGGAIAGAIAGAKLGAWITAGLATFTDLFNTEFFETFGKKIIAAGKFISDLWESFSLDGIKNFVTDKFNSFINGIKSFFSFFSDLPLLIEKTVSDVVGGGKIAKALGLRSVEDIDKDLAAKQAARTTPTNTTVSAISGSRATVDQTQLLTSGMQAPGTNRPGAAGTQQLTQQEAQNIVKGQAATAGSTAASNAPTRLDNETMIETLKKMDGVLVSLATNSPTLEQSKQLNTLIEQLVTINKQQLEANQDLVKATKGSYNPI